MRREALRKEGMGGWMDGWRRDLFPEEGWGGGARKGGEWVVGLGKMPGRGGGKIRGIPRLDV